MTGLSAEVAAYLAHRYADVEDSISAKRETNRRLYAKLQGACDVAGISTGATGTAIQLTVKGAYDAIGNRPTFGEHRQQWEDRMVDYLTQVGVR